MLTVQNLVLLAAVLLAAAAEVRWFGGKFKTALHMLQQEAYLNLSYMKWVKKNVRKNVLFADFLIPLVSALVAIASPAAACAVFAVLMFFAAWFRRKTQPKAKKPLVFTARVKRLVVTGSLLAAAAAAFVWCVYKNIYAAFAAAAVFNAASALFAALVNLINRPVELGVNRWYYNDAKKILKQRDDLTVIGITGSYGKTSSKFILAHILSEKYSALATPESYNTPMGVIKTVRMFLQRTHRVFVCEMGAKYVGDIKELCDLAKPKYGIITSIGPQHLETFKGIDNIVKTKFELYDALPDKSKLFVNVSSKLIKDNLPRGVRTYSLDKSGGGEYYAENISYGPEGAAFTLCGNVPQPIELHTKLLGMHNILNIVGAAALALELGLDARDISRAVRTLQPVTHRLELKRHANGVAVIDDAFNSNVEGAKSAVEVLGSFTKGKRMLITPGIVELGDKQYEYNFDFGTQAAKNCDYIILVGEKQARPIKSGIEKAGFDEKNLYIAADLNDALAKMNSIAKDGWTVLFENDLPDLYL